MFIVMRVMMGDMKESAIRSFKKIFVEIHEPKYCEDDIDIYVAIEFVDQFRDVRCNPAVGFRVTAIVDTVIIIKPCFQGYGAGNVKGHGQKMVIVKLCIVHKI
jgi:hypothetical protein